jgi:hypothetical protein
MTSTLIGYFPKRTDVPSGWNSTASVVSEICNVSTCLAPAPDGWIDLWRHNELGVFDSPELAESVIPEGAKGFSVFAYRLFPEKFAEGKRLPLAIEPVSPSSLPASFRSLGFDVVSKSVSAYFECSPLSCNDVAKEIEVNQYCLLESLETAVELATRMSRGEAEPGPYYIVEVLRSRPGA